MNRRHWLQLASASLLPCHLSAKEATGRWDDESTQEYCGLLFAWLEENFATRARYLNLQTAMNFELKYKYLAPTEDRAKQRMLEKFAKQRLSGRDFEEHASVSLAEFEEVRKSLAAAESQAAAEWKGEEREEKKKGGTVFDMDVTAGWLGVVLDNSRSMLPYLDKLRAEISRDFSDAYYVEVNGCDLSYEPRAPWFFSAPTNGVNPFTADRHIPAVPTLGEAPWSRFISWQRDAPGALHCMDSLMKMDAVYWFCDFDDDTDDAIIRKLARNYMASETRLYVHTLSKRPPELIKELAERSGGAVLRKRI